LATKTVVVIATKRTNFIGKVFMKKIEAINSLMSGECDAIIIGTSKFILLEDSIVNARSKKPLDMKGLNEDGWDVYVEPKWYDNIGDTDGIMCWVSNSDVSIVKRVDENGDVYNVAGDLIGTTEDVQPVSMDEIEEYIILGKKTKRKKSKREKIEDSIESAIEISEGKEESGLSQSETSENTALQKEDAGSEPVEDGEEIPF